MHGSARRAALEPVWAVPVLLGALAACVTARALPVVVVLVAVALVPWAFGAAGRVLPAWLFGLLGIAPVAGIIAIEDLSGGMFLATATLSQLASRPGGGRPRVAALAAVGVALPFTAALVGHAWDPGAVYFAIGDLFGIVVGLLVGRTRELGRELRAADARLAAADAERERTRLARDVHDLVAHSLTVVVLQVGGARRVLRADPATAERALEQAEEVCRESLDGVREVVGLLRAGDDPSRAALDVERLAETYRSAGVEVTLDDEGDAAGLPLLVRGTLYRVIQEALANAARYRTPGTAVAVRIRTDADGVQASVANRGAAPRRPGPRGFGLTGLREQVAAIGGTLTSGPAEGGWAVVAHLPRGATARRAEVVG